MKITPLKTAMGTAVSLTSLNADGSANIQYQLGSVGDDGAFDSMSSQNFYIPQDVTSLILDTPVPKGYAGNLRDLLLDRAVEHLRSINQIKA